jgi:hypothetical protein
MGTPHQGSGLAMWAKGLSDVFSIVHSTNPNIVSVLERDSEVLARIQADFYPMVDERANKNLSPIEITCFYEQLPVIKRTLVGQAESKPALKLTSGQ